jgi:hypothetical protein
MKRTIFCTLVLVFATSGAIGVICTRNFMGNRMTQDPQPPGWTCMNCPICIDSTQQTKCIDQIGGTPELPIAVTVTCGPCNSYSGGTTYIPGFSAKTTEQDSTCTPATNP